MERPCESRGGTPLAATPAGRVVALDLGDRRVGVACTDETRTSVGEVGAVGVVGPKRDAASIRALLWERLAVALPRDATLLVVGLPLLPDGREGEAAVAARARAADLARRLELPFVLIDERLTSVEARRELIEQGVSRRRRGRETGRVDARAAALILRAWLEEAEASRGGATAPTSGGATAPTGGDAVGGD